MQNSFQQEWEFGLRSGTKPTEVESQRVLKKVQVAEDSASTRGTLDDEEALRPDAGIKVQKFDKSTLLKHHPADPILLTDGNFSKQKVEKSGSGKPKKSVSFSQNNTASLKLEYDKSKAEMDQQLQDIQKKWQPFSKDSGFFMTTQQHKLKVEEAKKQLSTIFDLSRDWNKRTLYRDEGNDDFESDENREKRAKIKGDYYVAEAINTVKNAKLLLLYQFMKLYETDQHMCVVKQSYLEIHGTIAAILYPTLSNEAISELVLSDWQRDLKGREAMSRQMLFDGLFELVDV